MRHLIPVIAIILSLVSIILSLITGTAKAMTASELHGSFTSETEAAVHMAKTYNRKSISRDKEYVGIILKKKELYYYTIKQGAMEGGIAGINSVKFVVDTSKYRITAFWHSHGKRGHGREYFSKGDTSFAKNTGKPMYMVDHSYTLRIYKPRHKTLSIRKAKNLNLATTTKGAKGWAEGKVVVEDVRESI